MNSIRLFSKYKHILLFFAGAAFFFILYLPTLPNPFFTIDDKDLIAIPQLTNAVNFETFKSIFRVGSHIDYYPMRDLSYLFDVHVLDGSPQVFRLHQIFLVLGSVFVLALIFIELGIAKIPSVLGAWFWALCPLHVESVVWISSRKDLMAIFYALLSSLFFLKRKYKLCGCFFLVSLLSKASFIFLPFFGLFYLIFQRSKNKPWIPLGVLSILALSYGFFQKWIYSSINKMELRIPLDERVTLSLTALGKLILGWIYWPLNIVDIENLGSWAELNKGFFYVGIVVWLIFLIIFFSGLLKRKNHWVYLSIGSFLMYAPVSGLLFAHRNFYSVRYLEPLFLFLWIIAFVKILPKLSDKKRVLAGLLLFILAIIGTYFEVLNWNSNLSVRYKAYHQSPKNLSLRAQLLSELINNQRERGAAMEISDKKELQIQKDFLTMACQTPLHEEDCWRFEDMKYQMGKSSAKDFLDSLYKHQRFLSWSRYSVDWSLKTGKNLRDSLEVFVKYYHWFPTPQLRFENFVAICFLTGTAEAKSYFLDLKNENLINPDDFKARVSETLENNQKKLLSCMP